MQAGAIVRVFFQVGKGKKWNFSGGEKQELPGISPEKHAILRVKKLKTLFVENFRGRESILEEGSSPPCPTEKNHA